MEVDFAGKTFQMVDPLTGEVVEIVVFVAVLPYSVRRHASIRTDDTIQSEK